MRLRWIYLVLSLFSLSWLRAAPAEEVASSTADFETVSADLRQVTWVEADFTEEKTLHILTHPLHSSGTLMFSPQRGIYRVMTDPVHQEMLITRSELVQKDAQGNVQRMNVRGQQAAHAFVDIFLSFFDGDQKAWRKAFDMSFSGTAAAWTIEFVPHRKSPVDKALRRIVLEGRDGTLDAMTFTEANGDETHTVYSDQKVYQGNEGDAALRFPTDLKTP